MSVTKFKFIQSLVGIAGYILNVPIADGDNVPTAFGKLQGQINQLASSSSAVPTYVPASTITGIPFNAQLLYQDEIFIDGEIQTDVGATTSTPLFSGGGLIES